MILYTIDIVAISTTNQILSFLPQDFVRLNEK
jgi:hypothetical protein